MQEGYWINYGSNFKIFPIDEHERWVRDDKNAEKLGIPDYVAAKAKTIKDREKYLLFLMEHAPIMRVRGHGSYTTFEFHSRDRQDTMDAILIWGKRNAGPFTTLNIINFATHENTQMKFGDFEEEMDSGGAEAVLRVANATKEIWLKASVVKELLAISRQLISK